MIQEQIEIKTDIEDTQTKVIPNTKTEDTDTKSPRKYEKKLK